MPIWWDTQHSHVLRLHVPDITSWAEYDTLIDELVATLSELEEDNVVDIIVTREREYNRAGVTPHLQRAIKLISELTSIRYIITVQAAKATFTRVIFESTIRVTKAPIKHKFCLASDLAEAYRISTDSR